MYCEKEELEDQRREKDKLKSFNSEWNLNKLKFNGNTNVIHYWILNSYIQK